jgi:7,8-dihydropterin-6-yl-methyl-4-(beta-D-ribofuranosyl)aminobenzene 5'-phosphate synthase
MLLALLLGLWIAATGANAPPAAASRSGAVRVLVLSTMLADEGIGEWGFAALVEVDGHRLLFDTGARPDTVRINARELGVDLAGIEDVILSHHHGDHTGGLLSLRRELMAEHPKALARAHVGRGIFWSRRAAGGSESNPMLALQAAYEQTGAKFIEHAAAAELFPGVWLSGPVPRVHPERNWSGRALIRTDAGQVEDNLPEDLSLVIDTEPGLVILSGCGHAGIINTLDHARAIVGRPAPIHAALGGFHLFSATDEHLAWTAAKLRAAGLVHFLGAHCTGIEAVYRIREQAGLDRSRCVVAAVGSSFTLGAGIDPLALAH